MKELTIKTKAYDGNYKTYTELINRLEEVKDAIKKHNYGIAMDVLCKPYPEFQITTQSELEESEDERMRACIGMCLTDANEQRFKDYNTNLKECFAWLEKQCRQKEINLVEILKHYPKETELYSPLYGKLWLAEVDEKNEIITCYKYPLDKGCTRAVLEQEDTVSFYSNGTTGLPDFNVSKGCMLFLYNIEKQGEQKQDVNMQINPSEYINDMGGNGCYLKNTTQMPTDKVEPKFKVGDWITDGNITIQIEAIKNDCYLYCGDCALYSTKIADKVYHLWTLDDAKDGDVLCCESGWTCIFKALDNHTNTFSSYCFMDKDKWFCNRGSEGHTLDERFVKAYNGEISPATKEQRALFFQKMHEAGYEWYADKKELKKIEQKTAWSEEDERMFKNTIALIETLEDYNKTSDGFGDVKSWIKDRYAWKPSDLQIEALESATANCAYSEYEDCLTDLIEQLKKLKG